MRLTNFYQSAQQLGDSGQVCLKYLPHNWKLIYTFA